MATPMSLVGHVKSRSSRALVRKSLTTFLALKWHLVIILFSIFFIINDYFLLCSQEKFISIFRYLVNIQNFYFWNRIVFGIDFKISNPNNFFKFLNNFITFFFLFFISLLFLLQALAGCQLGDDQQLAK